MLAIYELRRDYCTRCCSKNKRSTKKFGVVAELIDAHARPDPDWRVGGSMTVRRHTETYRMFVCVPCFAEILKGFGDDFMNAASWTLYIQNSLGRPRYTEEEEEKFREQSLRPLMDSEFHVESEGVITGKTPPDDIWDVRGDNSEEAT
jgi:hypothetical protein